MDVFRGGILFVCGHNGSGKTTLLKLIGGREEPSSGVVELFDRASGWRNPASSRDVFTWIPQDVGDVLAGDMYVHEVVSLAPDPGAVRELAHKADAEWLGKTRDARLVKQLSGGEKQLFVGVMALATKAELLLLDEVLRSLDAEIRAKYWSIVKSRVRDDCAGAVVVSHDIEFVCSEPEAAILVLVKGKPGFCGKVSDLSARELSLLVGGQNIRDL